MKVKRAGYMDDGVVVPGVIIKRLFRRPVFFSADGHCGWDFQVIYKENEKNIIEFLGGCGAGKSVYAAPTLGIEGNESVEFEKHNAHEFVGGRGAEKTRWVRMPDVNEILKLFGVNNTKCLTKECANCPHWVDPSNRKGGLVGCNNPSIMDCKPFADKYQRWVASGYGEWPMDDFNREE